MHVLLFDIDGTLINTRGSGLESLRLAFIEVFDCPPPNDIPTCGRTWSVRQRGNEEERQEAARQAQVRQEDIVGRAVSVERNRMVLPVASGLAGHMLAAFIRALRMSDHLASHVLNPCYRGLARSGLFRALLPPALRPRVVTFERDGAREMQLVLGRRIIGRRPAGAGAWTIRRPFRIFVDEQALP